MSQVAAPRRRTGGFGPSVVVLSLLSAAWMASRGGDERTARLPDAAVPTDADPLGDVPVWVGQRGLDAGSAVRARLSPLHSDAAHQAFDGAALARRLELADGEPWRLELAYEARAGAPVLALAELAVEDDAGRRLAPPPVASDEAGAVADPLRALVAARPLAIAPGDSVAIVLWGARPGPGARVVGLADAAAPSIELAAEHVAGDALARPLSRVALHPASQRASGGER